MAHSVESLWCPFESDSSVEVTTAREFLEFVSGDGAASQSRAEEASTEELYAQIGRLKMELEWLKRSGYN